MGSLSYLLSDIPPPPPPINVEGPNDRGDETVPNNIEWGDWGVDFNEVLKVVQQLFPELSEAIGKCSI